jgi:RimJ/RimL family protein N-acetyltransferase
MGRVEEKMTTLKTDRLCLRPLRTEDAGDITRLIGEWPVIRWLTTPPWPYRTEDAEAFLAKDRDQEAHAITREGQFMGVVGIHPRDDAGTTHEIGYWLGTPFHGQGYMTEAATAAIDAFFATGADRLYSGYLIGNGASANVLAKLGFRVGGMHRALSRPLAREVMVQEVLMKAADWNARRVA